MKKIFIVVGMAILAISLSGCVNNNSDTVQNKDIKQEKTLFLFNETSFDFGKIKQSGGKVQHDFTFTYNGDEPIKVTGIPTSCACTTASIDKTEFKKGDKGTISVSFNPNLHQEPDGKFFKTIAVLTDPKFENIPEIKFWVEVDLDLGKDAYELKFSDDG